MCRPGPSYDFAVFTTRLQSKQFTRSDSLKCETYQAINKIAPMSTAIHKCSNAATPRTESSEKSIIYKKTKITAKRSQL